MSDRPTLVRWTIVGAAVVALVFAAVAARSGPSHPIAQLTPDVQVSAPAPVVSVPSLATSTSAFRPPPSGSDSWLGAALIAVLCAVLALLLFAVLRRVQRRLPAFLRSRGQPRLPPPPGATVALLDEAVEEGLADVERGPVTDAVIACWIRVERAARDAGIGLSASDTSQEFAARVLVATPAAAAALERLAALYREARFSSHELGEPVRDEARACLLTVRDDLRAHHTAGDTDAG